MKCKMVLDKYYNVTFGNWRMSPIFTNVRIDKDEFEMLRPVIIPYGISEKLRQDYINVKRRLKLK